MSHVTIAYITQSFHLIVYVEHKQQDENCLPSTLIFDGAYSAVEHPSLLVSSCCSCADLVLHQEVRIYTISNSVNCKVRIPCRQSTRAYRLVGIAAATNGCSERVFCLRCKS